MDENYISVNPMIGLSVSKSDIDKPKKKTREELVFTNKERDIIREYIKHDTANYFNSAPYAILLSFQLGLRVGELIALKWTDIYKLSNKYDSVCKFHCLSCFYYGDPESSHFQKRILLHFQLRFNLSN